MGMIVSKNLIRLSFGLVNLPMLYIIVVIIIGDAL